MDEQGALLCALKIFLPSWCGVYENNGQVIFQAEPTKEKLCYLIFRNDLGVHYSHAVTLPEEPDRVIKRVGEGVKQFRAWLDEHLAHCELPERKCSCQMQT